MGSQAATIYRELPGPNALRAMSSARNHAGASMILAFITVETSGAAHAMRSSSPCVRSAWGLKAARCAIFNALALLRERCSARRVTSKAPASCPAAAGRRPNASVRPVRPPVLRQPINVNGKRVPCRCEFVDSQLKKSLYRLGLCAIYDRRRDNCALVRERSITRHL